MGEIKMTFAIISIIVFNVIAIFMHKRISRVEIYATSLFTLFLEYLANYIFDFILGVYGYFKPGTDIKTFIIVVGIYPAVNTIFLNYFPYKRRGLTKFIYIMGVSLFSLFYEWLSLKSKYFYHDGWNLWLSGISYPILFGIIVLNLKFLRNLERREGR
jgi:hypothetical protein